MIGYFELLIRVSSLLIASTELNTVAILYNALSMERHHAELLFLSIFVC